MRWSSLKYLTKQGLENLAANRMMTVAGVGVLTVCLMLTCVAALFAANVDSLVDYLGAQNETVVYMQADATDEMIGNAYDEILNIAGVNEAVFVSKAEVLTTYTGYLEDYSEIWAAFEDDNPFKANYRVVISDLARMQEICDEIEHINGVYKVSPPLEMADIFLDIQNVITWAGYILVSVLAIVSMVVISNMIRLSVYARRKEINIMKYVGATDGFIRWPFFVEGVSVGLLASLFSTILVLASYATLLYLSQDITGFWETLLGSSVVPLSEVWHLLVIGAVAGGSLVGGIGSVLSIRKHLKV